MPPFLSEGAAAHFYRCRRVLLLMPPPMFIGAAGSFPFPREKGSEKGSQKVWECVCVCKNQTSSGSLVRSLVVGLGRRRIQSGSVSPRTEFYIKVLAAFILA